VVPPTLQIKKEREHLKLGALETTRLRRGGGKDGKIGPLRDISEKSVHTANIIFSVNILYYVNEEKKKQLAAQSPWTTMGRARKKWGGRKKRHSSDLPSTQPFSTTPPAKVGKKHEEP